MNIVRKLKINNITPTILTNEEDIVLNFIYSCLSNLQTHTHEWYPNSIFYMNSDGEYMLEYHKEYNIMGISRSRCWDKLVNIFNIKESDVEDILKYTIEQKLNIKINSVNKSFGIAPIIIDSFKWKSKTPLNKYFLIVKKLFKNNYK